MSNVSRKTIARALLGLLASGQNSSDVARQAAEYLVAEGRTRELGALARDLELLRYEQHGVLEASATSARELTKEVEDRITELLGAKRVVLDTSLNPDIVGGVRVRALDKQLDLSIESKLNTLRHADTKAA